MTHLPPRHVVVALTGASGSIYGLRLVGALLRLGIRVDFIVSSAGREVMRHETRIDYEAGRAAECLKDFLAAPPGETLKGYAENDFFSPPASGSADRDALIVCPCSTGAVGRFAHGIADGLVERAFEVFLKERRPIFLVPRETPLSAIALENLASLARLGVAIVPAMPGFYHHPQRIEDLVDFIVAKLLNLLNLKQDYLPEWGQE